MSNKHVPKIYIVLLLVFLFILISISIFIIGHNMQKTVLSPLKKVRYASVPSIVEAPAHVAYNNGFFTNEGLDLSLTVNPDGKTSLNQLFEGEVDIISVMATPVVYSSFNRDDFYILAKVSTDFNIHRIVARKDSNINSAEDLIGKKVAVLFGTSGHFYMDSWLLYNGLFPSDLNIINMNGPDSVEALINGVIDAMFCWFPFPVLAEKALGDNAMVFPPDDLIPNSWVIVVKKEYAHNNSEVIKMFLNGIIEGEKFIQNNPLEAIKAHSKISGVDEEILTPFFYNMGFNLLLDQKLILDMEDQVRWMKSYKYIESEIVPNYLDYIHPEALTSVKPESVTIITR
jgi:NitT/TauT family transport system substrate-binding protein